MGSKAFLLFSLVFVVGGVVFLTAFSFNMLPSSVYQYVYSVFSFGSPTSDYTYLTKFEGHWQTDLTPDSTQSDVAQCEPYSGVLTIHNGQVSGNLGALNKGVSIVANVDQEGSLTGETSRGPGNDGTIQASIMKTAAQGTWTDSLGCQGTLTMTKLDLYQDPSKGFLVSYTGEVMLKRGGASRLPDPGELLYVGDEIDVPTGGSAYLSIGLENVSLAANQTYTVVDQ